ncbi:ATP-binding cassette domain-containing protein [Roseomonas sp. OT10]|uniref:ATP-binding cassette domain-containing protein n=1 Tax=Roseomonas cutis TaxID=2897332 RepID=UPI001E61369D|nr:ATP-binding cassette domain-containing protein [Roseomonas sp. OT10]UFN50379.1 ATP-binding cassette domain-containing protein [Roseomonas sp. OT10]
MSDAPPLLSLHGIRRSYGAVEAVRGVDLEIRAGEVLALCGDNGAGKSSLVKVIAGAQPASDGTLRLRGEAVAFRSPQDALRRGIATIYQDLALAPRLSIAQNVFLGSELTRGMLGLRWLDKRGMAAAARGFLDRLELPQRDMSVPVERLSGGQRQAVAIARALRWQAELIIMDEPTAALGVKETAQVLGLIRRLHAEGKAVLLVSHNMADVCAVSTRVAIMKAGRKVIDRPVAGLDPDTLAHMVMTGQEAGAALSVPG